NSSTQGAADYYWDFGDGTTATGQNVIHSYGDTGTYTVTLIVLSNSGCSNNISQTITVTEIETGVSHLNQNKAITIWSNGNTVYVDFSRLTKTDATIEIYNVLGQELLSDKFSRNAIYNKAIENTEAGYVIVKVRNGNDITTKRVVLY
ncbi:MAG TPA: PKD domain-containing protein, partial [Chitinophagales bacterium]|nr:PKD domain-containing protein [Chitinophagales bacterium]